MGARTAVAVCKRLYDIQKDAVQGVLCLSFPLNVPGKRSGYCRNLGSLRAGTRHHGDFSVMGTSSLQPFLKSYWLTPVK